MAVTVFPLQGSGITYTEEPVYRLYDDLFNAGVFAAGDLLVSAKGTPDMSVSVAAGGAIVDFATPEGGKRSFYSSAVEDSGLPGSPGANWTATFTAADGTNPRIDRVVVFVADSFVDAGGVTYGKFRVVPGTPTAGATLANLNGAASLPANSLLLANVLIPASATTVTNANIDSLGDGFKRVRPRARFKDAHCQLTRAATQALGTSGTAAAIIWDTEGYDLDAMWAASGTQGGVTFTGTQIMARTPGYYVIRGFVRFAFNATGVRQVELKDEAATSLGISRCMAVTVTDETSVPFAVGPVLLGDAANKRYVTVEAMQRSGATLNIAGATVWMQLVNPA